MALRGLPRAIANRTDNVEVWLPLEKNVGRTLRLPADDESLALRPELALQEIPDIEIVGAASDGAQAISAMKDLRPDVVLLDIKMPLADGFEVANAVEDCGGPAVIFVSAFDSYAVRAFETSAVDYLVRPVEFERLASAIDRARPRTMPASAQKNWRRCRLPAARSRRARGPQFEKEF